MEPSEILDHARQRPGFPLRSRPGGAGRAREDRPDRLRVGRRAARASTSSSRRGASTPTARCCRTPRLHGPDRRRHPRPPQAKGYLADDPIGKAGVEATFESAAARHYGTEPSSATRPAATSRSCGRPAGRARGLVDADDRQDDPEGGRPPPSSGGCSAAGLKRGVFIVMNPQTGEILALVSLPTYDNNLFAERHLSEGLPPLVNNKNKPLHEPRGPGQLPAGSTYKLVTGTGALADKKITPDHAPDRGYLTLGGTRFYDWNHTGFGLCNINCGFGHSSDTFFFQLAGMLGADRLAYWAHQYGFGAPTGIDLPGEVPGIVPNNKWKMNALRPADVPGRDLPGGHRPGLRRRHADPADQRLRGPRERRQALPAADRPAGRRSRRQGHHAVQARPHPPAPAVTGDAARRCASRRATS